MCAMCPFALPSYHLGGTLYTPYVHLNVLPACGSLSMIRITVHWMSLPRTGLFLLRRLRGFIEGGEARVPSPVDQSTAQEE